MPAACRAAGAGPGGVRKELRTFQAVEALGRVVAETPIAQAKLELARELVTDLQRIDAQRCEAKHRAAQAVAASGTSITGIYGVGPIVAATVLGYVRDVRRFANRDRFASYDGTASIEVSSDDRKIYRLSRRGNRRLNHAIHMTALTQVMHRDGDGRTYYDRKTAQGMTGKSALRALKRKISDALYDRMTADARRREDPGGHSGNDAASSAAGSHETPPIPSAGAGHPHQGLDNKEGSICVAPRGGRGHADLYVRRPPIMMPVFVIADITGID